ncbi:MAG TPA: putative glycolipid-binding domain-containing protein [Gemmatimonadaceae bacterium]
MRWRRLDVPGTEEARVIRCGSGWNFIGHLRVVEEGVEARLAYVIECGSDWRTKTARIDGNVSGETIRFVFVTDGEGNWTRNDVPVPAVRGALDIDLGFTPATNTLPIRRLSLEVGASAGVRSAWLRFPGLHFEPLDQSYTRESERRFRYDAVVDERPFSAVLETDIFGRVLHYEGLWIAELMDPDSSVP